MPELNATVSAQAIAVKMRERIAVPSFVYHQPKNEIPRLGPSGAGRLFLDAISRVVVDIIRGHAIIDATGMDDLDDAAVRVIGVGHGLGRKGRSG